jgi:isopentenyl-diphosphate Delta-isomerase
MEQKVILVDKNDREIGLKEKMAAHSGGGALHRAISVFVFNSKGETMLQQRALEKYHSKGLWSNTCCSHPYKGENIVDAGRRRLKEEMGFDCELREVFSFIYKVPVGDGLTEHEFDHVLFGIYDKRPKPAKEEVMDWKWMGMKELILDAKKSPDKYTGWLKILVDGKLPKEVEKFLAR